MSQGDSTKRTLDFHLLTCKSLVYPVTSCEILDNYLGLRHISETKIIFPSLLNH